MIRLKSFLPLLLPLFFACQNAPGQEQVKQEIFVLHQLQRDFHFEKKAIEFANSLSENIIMLNRGKVSAPTREENIERFQNYFSSVEFLEWDDTAAPIIHISNDGSMAYIVVQKKVVLKYENELGDTLEETTQFAWLSVYEKENGGWKITCNASTNVL